jgi:pentatricopeptide repeat protein
MAARWEAALRYFNEARAAGAANEITYSAAIAACMRSNELDHGLGLLGDMQREGMRPDSITYSTLLLAAQRCGLWGGGGGQLYLCLFGGTASALRCT